MSRRIFPNMAFAFFTVHAMNPKCSNHSWCIYAKGNVNVRLVSPVVKLRSSHTRRWHCTSSCLIVMTLHKFLPVGRNNCGHGCASLPTRKSSIFTTNQTFKARQGANNIKSEPPRFFPPCHSQMYPLNSCGSS